MSSCFLCNRSATSCGTCVNFRRSLVGGLGYCALDAGREPLTGEERRPCWTGRAEPADGTLVDGGLLFVEPRPEGPVDPTGVVDPVDRIDRPSLEVRASPRPGRRLLEVEPVAPTEHRRATPEPPGVPPAISGR